MHLSHKARGAVQSGLPGCSVGSRGWEQTGGTPKPLVCLQLAEWPVLTSLALEPGHMHDMGPWAGPEVHTEAHMGMWHSRHLEGSIGVEVTAVHMFALH